MSIFVISARQIRAARGLIEWSQDDLAGAAQLSRSHIAGIEKGKTNATREVMDRIRTVLESNQVEFLPQDGVRIRHPTISNDDLPEANRRLLEDIYHVAYDYKSKYDVGDILIFGLREEDAQKSVGDYLIAHMERLKLAGLHEKILCGPDTRTFVAPRSSYRRLPKLDPAQSPVHIYGDKIAVVHWSPKEFVITIESRPIATALRAMFYQIWDAQKGIEEGNS